MPRAFPPTSILQAAKRLSSAAELDMDIISVVQDRTKFTYDDFAVAPSTGVTVASDGTVRLEQGDPVSLFSKFYEDGTEEQAMTNGKVLGDDRVSINFWPNPADATCPREFILDSVRLRLGTADTGGIGRRNLFRGKFRVQFYAYDDHWRQVQLGSVIDVPFPHPDHPGAEDFIHTINLAAEGRRLRIVSGEMAAVSGSGRTSDGTIRNTGYDKDKGGCVMQVWRGYGVEVWAEGDHPDLAHLWCYDSVVFPVADFWRSAPLVNDFLPVPGHSIGPWDPTAANGNNPVTAPKLYPADIPTTGAVPNYGALAVEHGYIGMSRRRTDGSQQSNADEEGDVGSWMCPQFDIRAVQYVASGTIAPVFSFDTVPVERVQLRIDDNRETLAGANITYALEALDGADWIDLGEVRDGDELGAAGVYRNDLLVNATPALYQSYRLTATLTAGGSGGIYNISPAIHALAMVERRRMAALDYVTMTDVSSVTMNPEDGTSSVQQVRVPLARLGRGGLDLAARLTSETNPVGIELAVYWRNRATGERWYENSFRLESREPGPLADTLVFTSGLDRLGAKIPGAFESYAYPSVGLYRTLESVTQLPEANQPYGTTYDGGDGALAAYDGYTIFKLTIPGGDDFEAFPAWQADTPSVAENALVYMRTGVAASKIGLRVVPSLTEAVRTTGTDLFVLVPNEALAPEAGDTFTIHSGNYTREAVDLPGVDLATAYERLMAEAQVPSRYLGAGLPADASRPLCNLLVPADGKPARDALKAVGMAAGGGVAWVRGRMEWVDIYSRNKDSVAVWDDRHWVSLSTPTGMDQRKPVIDAAHSYSAATGAFGGTLRLIDGDTFRAMGAANLEGPYQVPDETAKLCTEDLALWMAQRLQDATSSGVRQWKSKMVHPWPEVGLGDTVTLLVEGQYTDRRFAFDAYGNDTGRPIRGKISVLAVVIGHSLDHRDFLLFVPGVDAISDIATGSPVSIDFGAIGTPQDALTQDYAHLWKADALVAPDGAYDAETTAPPTTQAIPDYGSDSAPMTLGDLTYPDPPAKPSWEALPVNSVAVDTDAGTMQGAYAMAKFTDRALSPDKDFTLETILKVADAAAAPFDILQFSDDLAFCWDGGPALWTRGATPATVAIPGLVVDTWAHVRFDYRPAAAGKATVTAYLNGTEVASATVDRPGVGIDRCNYGAAYWPEHARAVWVYPDGYASGVTAPFDAPRLGGSRVDTLGPVVLYARHLTLGEARQNYEVWKAKYDLP